MRGLLSAGALAPPTLPANQATISGPDAAGILQMTGDNVVMPGDTFSVWIDAGTRQTRRVHAGTFFQGNVVSLSATFKTLGRQLSQMPSTRCGTGPGQGRISE